MLKIVGAIANGGTYPTPYFVKAITTQKGTVKSTQTTYLQPYFSESTAGKLNDMLRSDVVNYYGDGKFSGLKMCGKTGTAEVSTDDNGLAPHAWFVGYSQREYLPLAVVVVVENGGGGGSVAIPVASKTMKKAASIYAEK